jgi:hypothetical protein
VRGLTRGGDVGVATRVGPKVQTVLGLSMTSTSVGWALLDGQDPGAVTLDHDAFDVQSGAGLGDMSQHAAAARGAHAIAAASGHTVGSVRVTWSQDVEASATALLKSLADLEFDNVVAIPLRQATQSWAIEAGRANEHNKTALCILEPGTATVMVVATGAGSVRTAVTNAREHAADLVDWLTTIFNRDGWLPECLYLVGSDDDLDAVTAPISDGLPIPVFDSVDSRLALARGAALATVGHATVVSSPVAETPRELKPRPDRPRLLSDVKKVTTSAAAVAVVGAALSLAAGSALNGEKVSTQAANPQAAGASVTSASVHAVPAPVFSPPAPPVQALAAAPPPATPAPPETHTLPAEPLAVVEPEPVSVPVPQHTASPPANVSAAPLAAPPAPTAPPPAAPVTAPAALSPAAPLAAPPAPIAPPAQAVTPDPLVPPPPPDPLQAVLSPLFSGLP